jgi:hypothetical protein
LIIKVEMRKLAVIILLVFLHNKINAQNAEKKLSMQFGYCYSSQNPTLFDIGHIRSPRFALHTLYYNIQYQQPINKLYALSIGVQLVEKGFKSHNVFTGVFLDVKLDYAYRLNYIELPLMVQRYFFSKPTSPKSYWIAKAGVVGSYLLEGNYRIEQLDEYKNASPPFQTHLYYNFSNTLTNRFNRWDFGMVMGLGKMLTKDFEVSVTMQKHFIETNKIGFVEMRQQQTFMFGLVYHIL